MTANPNSSSFTPEAPTIPGPDPDTRRPRVKIPAGACDCHAHVFGPQQQYPFAPNHGYVPPEASTDDYVRMLRAIGCERAVIVHPSVYGTDWPHPNTEFMPNDGDLADMLLDWIPDAALRQRVLVDNPARHYDFN